jgi:hypothetical protein
MCCECHAATQDDLFSYVGVSFGGLVQQAQQGAQQLGDALRAGKIVSWSFLETRFCV